MIDRTFSSILETQPRPTGSMSLPPPNLPSLSTPAISQAIIFLPVTSPVDDLLSGDRAETISHVDVEAMNAELVARLKTTYDSPPIKLPTVFNQMLMDSETTDGLHFSAKIVKQQAEILLGWRCNDVAGSMQGSCCKTYKRVTPMQGLLLAMVVGWAPLGMLLNSRKGECREDYVLI